MKKIITLFIMILGINIVSAEESCNSFYKINMFIEGKGQVTTKLSDKSYNDDNTFNVKCGDNFLFELAPEEGYKVDGVYYNGNHLKADSHNIYGLYNILANANVKVVFNKEEEKVDNNLYFESFENNISLFMDDLKEENNIMISLKEIDILLSRDFIKNSSDNITIIADQLYKDDLNYKQQKAASDSLYYDINIYSGEKDIGNYNGNVTISIPYSKSSKAFVYKADKNGKLTLIKNTYDSEKVSFDIKENGTYIISKEKLNEMGYIKSIINFNNKEMIAFIGLGFAIGILVLLIIIKRRK